MRTIEKNRVTKETNISIVLNLDSNETINVNTGVPFFDHMLEAFAFYANISLEINCIGDLEIDDHHTVEDIGITLGQAFFELLSKNKNITRFSQSFIPMDEALSRVVLDISNRPFLVYDVTTSNEKIGTFTVCNTKEFFRAFVNEARMTLHITNLYGENDHHILESIFKAFGKAVKESIQLTNKLQSTKGVL